MLATPLSCTLCLLVQALAQASAGRAHILSQMQLCSPPPAGSLSKWAPRVVQMTIPVDKLGALIGPVSWLLHLLPCGL